MPKLIRLYISQCLIGFGIAFLFTALLLYMDVAGLYYLVTHTDVGWFAALLMWLHFGLIFAAVQFAIAIMRMGQETEDSDGGTGFPHQHHGDIPAQIPTTEPTSIPRAGTRSLFAPLHHDV